MNNKPVLFYIVLLLLFAAGCKDKSDKDAIKVMTLNVRHDNPADSLNSWAQRAPIVSKFLKDEKPEIIGLQEVLASQYGLLDSVLTEYGSAGIGREDGIKKGEMNPIFFNRERFDMIRTKTFWLSETPDNPGSVSWGASLPRIVTWMELSDKITGKHFFFFNTHFAHDSDTARIMSSHLLLGKVDSIASGFPFIITGDFNMIHSAESYRILTGPYESFPLLADAYAISDKRHTGPAYTYNGFSDKTKAGRIDYIFVRNGMKVEEHRAFIRKENGIYISDHWPVEAVVSLK